MSATARLQTRFIRGGKELRQIHGRLTGASEWTAGPGPQVVRASVREEFLGQFWYLPGGGTAKWAPRRSQRHSNPLLRLTGRLFSAWMGGAGSVLRSAARSFSVGVNLAYAEVHRGGGAGNVSTAPIWKNIIPRPHATTSPELRAKLSASYLRFVLGRS